jgi:60 kDa SS-A/Ro ribonucleoprotein
MKKILAFLHATEEVKNLTLTEEKACELIIKHGLVREHLRTELLMSVGVWRALLQKMPMTAMIKNLGKMTNVKLLTEGSSECAVIIDKLTDEKQLKKARIHPFNVLLAYEQYNMGRGDKGHLVWKPIDGICQALEKAFYLSFKSVEPTKKRYCIALDISGSMDVSSIMKSSLNARKASAAMAMVTVRTEPRHNVIGFHDTMKPLDIKRDMHLNDVISETSRHGFGATDCAKPMEWAITSKKLFDVFIVYTDNETWCGRLHPSEAMRRYRLASGILDSKLIVVGMTSTDFSIADPEDPNMIDIVGFDADAPKIIRQFSLGEI